MGKYKNDMVEWIGQNISELECNFIKERYEEEFNIFCDDRFADELQGRADRDYDMMKEAKALEQQ